MNEALFKYIEPIVTCVSYIATLLYSCVQQTKYLWVQFALTSNNYTLSFFVVTTLERLQTDLLVDYKKVRPVISWTDTVNVIVGFSLYQVKSLVSKAQLNSV